MNELPLNPEKHLAALDKSFLVFLNVASEYPRELVREKPSEKAFSATEILYHMLDVERLWQRRIHGMIEGTMTHFQQMDPDKEALEGRYNNRPYDEGIPELQRARKETHEFIRSMKPHEFEITGVHSKYGEMNIYRILEIMEGHDRNHTAQLERTLAQVTNTHNSQTL
jgi:uncharacterized damage-inducible protein DinB